MQEMYKKERIKRIITIFIAILILAVFIWLFLGFGYGDDDGKTNKVADVQVIEKEKTLDESIRAKFSEELTKLQQQDKTMQTYLEMLSQQNEIMATKDKREREKMIAEFERKLEETKQFSSSEMSSQMGKLLEQIKLESPEDMNKNFSNIGENKADKGENDGNTDEQNDKLQEQANLIPPPPSELVTSSTSQSESGKKSTGSNYLETYKEPAPAVVSVMTGLISVGAPLQSMDTKPKEDVKKKKDLIIPAGSFAKATLLSGVIAPTMGKGATDPVPSLIRITGFTQLPNFFKADIKDCFVLAETKGNLATETVSFRLKNLSCKKTDGTTIERDIDGYVTGENGMEGMFGRVVSKQGALLARAFFGEFASGIADAFEQAASVQTYTGSGVIETVSNDKIAQAGIAGGISESFDRLGEFYLDLADNMVPVIEINAGRTVDLVFIKSIDLNDEEPKKK